MKKKRNDKSGFELKVYKSITEQQPKVNFPPLNSGQV